MLCSGAALLEGEAVEVPGVVGVSIKVKLLRLKDNVRWVTVAVGLVGLFLITVTAEWVRFRFKFRGIVSLFFFDWFALPGKPVRFASWTCVPFRATVSFVLILFSWVSGFTIRVCSFSLGGFIDGLRD